MTTLHDDVLDAALDEFATTVTITVCSAEPANYAGISAVALAEVTVTAGDGNGDFTISNGDTSGRKCAVAAQADVTIDSSGTASHLAYDDGTTLQATNDLSSTQVLTAAGTVTIPTHDLEIADPTNP